MTTWESGQPVPDGSSEPIEGYDGDDCMEDNITIAKKEYDRLRAIEVAAVRAINITQLRNTTPEKHKRWIAAMNALGQSLPVTRRFDHDPLV